MAPCEPVPRHQHCAENLLNFCIFFVTYAWRALCHKSRENAIRNLKIYQLVDLQQEADGVGPVTANFRLVCAVGHRHGHRFHFNGASLGIKSARPAVFLDNPKIEAAGCSLFYQARSYFPKESSAYSLPHILRGHVEIVEERTERRMVAREDAGKSHQLRAFFRKDGEKRLAVYFRKTRLPQSSALPVDVVIEVIAGQDSSVGGTPALGVQMRDGSRVVLGGIAQGHHGEPNFRLNPTNQNGIGA